MCIHAEPCRAISVRRQQPMKRERWLNDDAVSSSSRRGSVNYTVPVNCTAVYQQQHLNDHGTSRLPAPLLQYASTDD